MYDFTMKYAVPALIFGFTVYLVIASTVAGGNAALDGITDGFTDKANNIAHLITNH